MSHFWRSPRFWGFFVVAVSAFFLSVYPVRSQTTDTCLPGGADYFPYVDLIVEARGIDQIWSPIILVSIHNRSPRCAYVVGGASYTKADHNIDNQELYESYSGVVYPGESLYFDISHHPRCAAQVDVFYGDVLTSLRGQRYGERLLWAANVNGNSCLPSENPPTVNVLDDLDDGVCDFTHCSLREAINAVGYGQTVFFDEALRGQTITLTQPIYIAKGIILQGLGMTDLTITGIPMSSSAFNLAPIDSWMQVRDLNFEGFHSSGDGAVISEAVTYLLDIYSCRFANNSADGNGGVIWSSDGSVSITSSIFENNHANGQGGAILADGSMQISNSRFEGNSAAEGGALYSNWGGVTIHNSEFLNNVTTSPTSYDVHNARNEPILDATMNYWGAPDGPSGFGPGSGDSVSDYIAFEPFIGSGSLSIPTSSSVSSGSSGFAPGCAAGMGETLIVGNDSTDVCVSRTTHHTVSARDLDASGIGVQSVIDQGVIRAVDVSGWLSEPLEVCLPGDGGILFLDAANSPRVPVWMPVTHHNGTTCTTITTAGAVVLVERNEYNGATSLQTVTPLEGCRVQTLYLLNLRESPDGTVIGQVPYDLTLQAIGRTSDWFNVIFEDTNGWISASHVHEIGTCGD